VKFLAPETHVVAAHPVGEQAALRYASGWHHEAPAEYAPEEVTLDGRSFHAATPITSHGWIEVAPRAEDVEITIWIRNLGLVRRDFEAVHTLTGSIGREVPNEIRPLPDALDAPFRLEVRQLMNVYNDYRFEDGDLLLVEVEAGDAAERYLFQSRAFGLRTKFSGGVLVAPPMPFLPDQPDQTLPIVAGTFAAGWRPNTPNRFARWCGDNLAGVVSVGIGSTTLGAIQGSSSDGLEDQLDTYFNAALAGAGVEIYDFLSVQALANLSALTRDLAETPSAIAIGFDAVRFSAYTRDAAARLTRPNPIDEP